MHPSSLVSDIFAVMGPQPDASRELPPPRRSAGAAYNLRSETGEAFARLECD